MLSAVRASLKLLSRVERRIYVGLVLVRGFLNFLDFVGVALVGWLGAVVAAGISNSENLNFFGFDLARLEGNSILILAGAIMGLFMAKSIAAAIFLRIMVTFLAKIETVLATEIVAFIFGGSLSQMRRFSRGEAYFAAQGSVHQAITGLLTSFSTVISEGALFVLIFALFIAVDPVAAMMISGYFVVLVVVFQFAIGKRLKRIGTEVAESQIGITNALTDLGAAFREIRVIGVDNHYLSEFSRYRGASSSAAAREKFLLSLPRYFVESALVVGVLVLVWSQVATGDLENGIVTTSVFLAGGVKMMAALIPIQNAYATARFLSIQSENAQNLISEARQPLNNGGMHSNTSELAPSRPPGKSGLAVSIEDMSFTHPDGVDPVLMDISLDIPGGSYVAFVGPSGAGKTTLADLILGMNSPDSGEIRLNGMPPNTFREVYPGAVAYVPQSPGVVAGSIAQNVALGENIEDISEQDVYRCLDLAELTDFHRRLPKGIHTSLGKQMDALSVGQKQRLGLARALYTNPRLIVLDEATSALDASAEASITETMKQLGSSTTVIVIAHRLSTIQSVDTVFVLEAGRIIDRGAFPDVRRRVPLIEEYVRLMTFD